MEGGSAKHSAFIMGNASVLMVLTTVCLLEAEFGGTDADQREMMIIWEESLL